jgi:hypothetical protein
MVEITQEKVGDLKNTVVSFFKDVTNSDVELKDWHFNTQKAEDGNTIDFGAKLLLKPKKK